MCPGVVVLMVSVEGDWKPHCPCLMVTNAASRFKISSYLLLLLQTASGGCFSGFASVSLNTGTLHVCVMWSCDSPSCTAFQSLLSPLLLVFSQYQNHKSHDCNSECICAAGVSARNVCGRVAGGAWMNDWTEVNATKAVGGKSRLEIGSPTTLICSLQWCMQVRRGWRGLYSPNPLNSMWFCLGRIFVSVLFRNGENALSASVLKSVLWISWINKVQLLWWVQGTLLNLMLHRKLLDKESLAVWDWTSNWLGDFLIS